jgi:DNA mismatch repair protein MutS2
VQRQAGAALAADRMQRRAERLLDAVERRLEPVIQEVPAARRPALRPLSAGELAVGMAVYVEPLHMSATVLDCGRDGVLVQAGDKRVRVPVAWLCRREEFAAPPPEESVPPRPAAAAEAADDTLAATELHVIGRSAEDALAELDRFLDLMFRQEQRKISVVHGMGRGILRAAIHRRLRETPFVRHFYHPPYADGGEGKTIVELDV